MPRTREEILRERRQLKAEYGDVFDSVAALLFRHDPIGIAFENENTNEYEPEAGTILPRVLEFAAAQVVAGEMTTQHLLGNCRPELAELAAGLDSPYAMAVEVVLCTVPIKVAALR